MTSEHLLNYLLTYRKRSALSQEEVAYLLGAQSGARISRHERFSQEPSLRTALAYEAIYERPVSELFPELFEEIKMAVKARAKKLEQKEFPGKASGLTARKRHFGFL